MSRITTELQTAALDRLREALIGANIITDDAPALYVKEGNSTYGYSWEVSTGTLRERHEGGTYLAADRLVVKSYGTRRDFYNAIEGATRALDLVNP